MFVSLLVTWTALAQAPATSPWEDLGDDGAASPPATVLEHRMQVTVDGAKRLRTKQTWTIQIDNPAACAAGVRAPEGMDGAADGGAQIFEAFLLIPPDTSPGTVFTLERSDSSRSGPYSGVFLTVPDLPTEFAEVVVKAPSWVPLTTWADEDARPRYERSRTRSATARWDQVDPRNPGEFAWSTWQGWAEAEQAIERTVSSKLATQSQLGPDIASDLDGISLAVVAERVTNRIEFLPGPATGWSEARPALEVLRSNSGSSADRGVLMLSLLRAAGYTAKPALYRPASTPGDFPAAVPAPAILRHPLIEVTTPTRTVLIDPAAQYASVPDLPASLVASTVWTAGDLPRQLAGRGVVDGSVSVNTTGTLDREGSLTWTSNINVQGTAAEALRRLLAPLSEDDRQEAIRKLAAVSRPGLDRFTLGASGIEDPTRVLTLTIGGHQPAAMRPLGLGLEGAIPPTLGPALTAWLPPNILVRESLALTPPPGMVLLTGHAPPSAYRREAMLSRQYSQQGNRAVLGWEAQRPYRVSSPSLDSAARSFLHEGSAMGTKVIVMRPITGQVAASVRKAPDLTPGEAAVVEALAWWSGGLDNKAQKVLKKAFKSQGLAALVEPMLRLAPTGDPDPWIALDSLTEVPEERLRLVEGYASRDLEHEAWLLASELDRTGSPKVRVDALLYMERLQPEQAPDGGRDQQGAAAWAPRADLLQRATAAWREVADAPVADHPVVQIRQAELALDDGDATHAEALLDRALSRGEAFGLDPADRALARVMRAQAGAKAGLSVAEIVNQIDAAVAEMPFDVEVLTRAAEAMTSVGDAQRSLKLTLTAAWLAHDDPERWSAVVPAGLKAADLPIAGFAARRASDLRPTDSELARQLLLVATLMHDAEAADLGRSRAREEPTGSWPPAVDDLMALTPPEGLLAMLDYHDEAVTSSQMLLGLRAQLRIDSGHLDGAARDGQLLARTFRSQEGTALAFAATVGRLWSPSAEQQLGAVASRNVLARMTRMEHRLIAGGDPTADARGLQDDPRGDIVYRAAYRPASVADELPGWPDNMKNVRTTAPSGLRTNTLLSKAVGVNAYSDPDRALTVILVNGFTGLLPPPLGNLYTPVEPAVESLPQGGQVLRLAGGVIPLYAAFTVRTGGEIIGLGHTIGAAKHAVELAQP